MHTTVTALSTALAPAAAQADDWGGVWGSLVWGDGPPTAVPLFGPGGLIVLGLLFVAVAWRWGRIEVRLAQLEGRRVGPPWVSLLARRPWLGRALSAALVVVPLTAYAAVISVPNTFVNGTVADANEVNANFDELVIESNAQHSRIASLESQLVTLQSQLDAIGYSASANSDIINNQLIPGVNANSSGISTVQADIAAVTNTANSNTFYISLAAQDIFDIEATLAGVSRVGDELIFSGMNVQIVNGAGATLQDNGLGNLVLGYNEPKPGFTPLRSGSHNLVVGFGHEYLRSGSIISGRDNTLNADNAALVGGRGNQVDGDHGVTVAGTGNVIGPIGFLGEGGAAIVGGEDNSVTADQAVAIGGETNTASGIHSVALGGQFNSSTSLNTVAAGGKNNRAQAIGAVALGGGGDAATDGNVASGLWSVAMGGRANEASGEVTVASGGMDNQPDGLGAVASGGGENLVTGMLASITGGQAGLAGSDYATVSGGQGNKAIREHAHVSGGALNTAEGDSAAILGGNQNFARGFGATVLGGIGSDASGDLSAAVGGEQNEAFSDRSVVVGGFVNVAGDPLALGSDARTKGSYGVVLGGQYNLAVGRGSVVMSGGTPNTGCGGFACRVANIALADWSAVVGGTNNRTGDLSGLVDLNLPIPGDPTIGRYATVHGGSRNLASGDYSAVLAGESNDALGVDSVALGGNSNTASGAWTVTVGGQANSSESVGSIIVGGEFNQAVTNSSPANFGGFSVISGGFGHTVDTDLSWRAGSAFFMNECDPIQQNCD